MGRATDGWLVGQVGLALVLTLVVCIGLGPLATTASWGFSDVPSDYWAYRWIAWLADLGLVAGYPDGTYQPENVVTRGQMAVFVSRAVYRAVAVRGTGWAELMDASSVDVCAVADPDASDYRLYSSADGITFSLATTAVRLDSVFGLVRWEVPGVTTTTYFKPVTVIGSPPDESERPLCGVLQARPSEGPSPIVITQPASATGVARVPLVAWESVPNAASYLVAVMPDTGGAAYPVYLAVLAGWRTSVLYGTAAGPGVLAGFPEQEALTGSTAYVLYIAAVDASGWKGGSGEISFTTSP